MHLRYIILPFFRASTSVKQNQLETLHGNSKKGKIQASGMSEKKSGKNDGDSEINRIFVAPKKGLWLTLSSVCLAGLEGCGYCLSIIGAMV